MANKDKRKKEKKKPKKDKRKKRKKNKLKRFDEKRWWDRYDTTSEYGGV